MSAKASSSQNSTTTRRRSELAVLVGPGMDALDHPPAASLDGCWQSAGGDLAEHAAVGQHVPTGLVVIASVQVAR
jgi:hypothetical protein